jgi:ribosome-associated translation inhibitor RaiA
MTIASRAVEISGLRGAAALRARIGERVTAALEPIKLKPVSAHIAFFDDNGPKGGGIRCAFTVRLPYRPALRVEHMAETARLAFDGGFGALERLLERYRERERDNLRHPKKYFVAKRLTEGLPAAARASRAAKSGERRGPRKSS